MPWWGYLILGIVTVFWIWIIALINKDEDHLIDKGYKDERRNKK